MPIVVHKYDAPLLEAIMQGNLDATKSILQTEGGALLFHEKNSAGDTVRLIPVIFLTLCLRYRCNFFLFRTGAAPCMQIWSLEFCEVYLEGRRR